MDGGREEAKRWAQRAGALGEQASWERAREVALGLPGMLWSWGRSRPEEAGLFCAMAAKGVDTMGDALACGFAYWAWCAGAHGSIPFFTVVLDDLDKQGRRKVSSAFDLPRRWPALGPGREIMDFAQDALGQAFARMEWSGFEAGRVEGIHSAPLAWARWRPDPDDFAGQDWGKLAGWCVLAMEPFELEREARAAPGLGAARL